MATPETAADVLGRLQGVWFPTRITADGRLTWEGEPRFPAGHRPWLMTVAGDTAHVTADADYYATGGRLRVNPAAGRLVLEYPPLPPEWDTQYVYRLAGDELELAAGGFGWSGPHDAAGATCYVRVAAGPTPEMAALIESAMRGWAWYPGRAAPGTSSSPDDAVT